jgi:hypothetical protein
VENPLRVFGSGPAQPFLKSGIHPFKHFRVNLPLIGKLLTPASVVMLLPFEFDDEFLHQHCLIPMVVSQMLFAQISRFLQSILGAKAHIIPFAFFAVSASRFDGRKIPSRSKGGLCASIPSRRRLLPRLISRLWLRQGTGDAVEIERARQEGAIIAQILPR